MSRADRLAAIESGAFAPWAAAPIVANTKTLSDAEAAGCRADATAGSITLTLPAANTPRDVYIRRIDVTQNAIVILAAGTDKLMLDTTAAVAGQTQTELLFAGDWMQLRSDGAGKWWCVGQAQLPGSISSGLVAYTAPGSHTFTVPAVLRSGRRVPTVTVVGGGGGGCEGPMGVRGGGGGGGGTAIRRAALIGIGSVSIVVGTYGAGSVGVQSVGATGGTSSFGEFCSATGGRGGGAFSSGGGTDGGIGGAGSGGDVNVSGGSGSDSPNGGAGGGSGDGGSCSMGGGARSGSAYGESAAGHGGGGGGGTGGVGRGGDGASGLVLIEW